MMFLPRSSLALQGIIVPNSPGIIDSDYRGACAIMLLNTTEVMFTVFEGDRIGQMILSPIVSFNLYESNKLSESSRSGGFGSTGK